MTWNYFMKLLSVKFTHYCNNCNFIIILVILHINKEQFHSEKNIQKSHIVPITNHVQILFVNKPFRFVLEFNLGVKFFSVNVSVNYTKSHLPCLLQLDK